MQKPKVKLQIVIFLEFWVVFTFSFFLGNPVVCLNFNVSMFYKQTKPVDFPVNGTLSIFD